MAQNQENIQIIGCRGSIESKDRFIGKVQGFVAKPSVKNTAVLQCVNADLVCGKEHLLSAYEHARRAFERGENISSSLAMEILLYAAGEVQISSALAKIGLSDGSENVACIIDPEIEIGSLMAHLDLTRDDDVLECTEEKLLRFGITKESISAAGSDKMADLVLEKVSMVDVRK
jgi:KEOPS complex subunit Cgi121